MADQRDISTAEEHANNIKAVTSSHNTLENVLDTYKQWAVKYDKDSQIHVTTRRGPECAANTLAALLGDRKQAKILDLGAGTGQVGEKLHEQGFTNIDGIDGSTEMLEVAQGKGIYKKLICDCIGPSRLDIDDGTYDALVHAGLFAPNHANDSCFEELIRICKPGGLMVFAMTQKFLTDPYFKDRLEPRILELEEQGAWKWLERRLEENYVSVFKANDKVSKRHTRGVIYVLQKED